MLEAKQSTSQGLLGDFDCSEIIAVERELITLSMVAYASNPGTRKLKQEDGEFGPSQLVSNIGGMKLLL